MPTGDHYVLTVNGLNSITNEATDNVYVYEQTAGFGDSTDLLSAFGTQVYDDMTNILHTTWTCVDFNAYSLEDPADFDIATSVVVGQRTGEAMPAFVTASFRYVRSTRAVSDGRKAYGPISESDVDDGDPTGAYLTLLSAMATALQNNLTHVGSSSSWKPVIWRRPGTYASGVVTAPGLFYDINSVIFRAISTQNTRKRGRGA